MCSKEQWALRELTLKVVRRANKFNITRCLASYFFLSSSLKLIGKDLISVSNTWLDQSRKNYAKYQGSLQIKDSNLIFENKIWNSGLKSEPA